MDAQDLKNSILQLAIQGKLVEQREEDGSSKELLEQIKSEKKQLITEGKIKKQKELPKINEDEILFDIPESWEWVRLADLALFIKAGGDKPKDFLKEKTETHTVPVIANGIQNKGIIGYTKEAMVEEPCITVSGRGTIGFSCIRTEPFTPVVRLLVLNISCHVDQKYIQQVLTALLERGVGTSIKQLTVPMLEPKLIPLPPLGEQKRIVAKIEELMPYVEKYDEAYTEVEELNKKFPEDMQKSILQYAIQGKLVKQREEEGTAEELYKQIQEEKKKLVKEGKIKKSKALSEIAEDDIPFDIPESWKWVRLGDLFNVSTGMTPSKSNPLFHENGDIPWITSSQTGDLKIKKANNFITKYAIENTSLKLYPKHTLLIAMYGQGKTRGQISELLLDATINQACAALENIIDDDNLRNYIQYFQMYNYDISRTGSEGSAQPNLNLDKIRSILVPLPPLEEQKRIVAKIEELLPYIKQLVK
ncbi:restriction endonuclease subunit S [Bacillus sp. JJ1773]|uniref:restriction endonuclease subunit S n=1 Tax=Bacillus sp. JJ1773 TaxID=3122965 RepID=UPI002FFF1A0E